MKQPSLTTEQIDRAKSLREGGLTKRELATMFNVGQTTIWDNVFRIRKIRLETEITAKCNRCEIRLKDEFELIGNVKRIPHNYKLGDKCLDCVLEEKNLTWEDMNRLGIIIYT